MVSSSSPGFQVNFLIYQAKKKGTKGDTKRENREKKPKPGSFDFQQRLHGRETNFLFFIGDIRSLQSYGRKWN